MSIKKISNILTHDVSNGGIRAMLYGLGLTEKSFNNSFIGVGSMHFDINPCNKHLKQLQNTVINSLNHNNQFNSFGFNTIGVSDGITNGNSGMNYSLPSRELIADSIETMIKAHHFDGLVLIPGCDKNIPASMMAMGRINIPSILIYGGTILPGKYKDKDVDIVDAFESYGRLINGDLNIYEREDLLKQCCDKRGGSCSGMYTCNTMAIISETMGLSPLFSSTYPASSEEKKNECENINILIKNIISNNILPREIISRESFLNAIKITTIMGGSTNSVIHLLAIAKEFNIELTLDDFNEINNNYPVLSNLKPHGKYVIYDIHKDIGGFPTILKYLINNGLINGDTYTMTGNTLKEDIEKRNIPDLKFNQNIFFKKEKPFKQTGHIKVLYGNLCKDGAIAKISGIEGNSFKGPAIVFETEDSMLNALTNKEIKTGMVIIIRNQGPKGGIGMPEMLKPSSALVGAKLASTTALLTDGRWSGGSSGFLIGHITPEAYEDNSIISIVENKDIISIDINSNNVTLHVSEKIINNRLLEKKKQKEKDIFNIQNNNTISYLNKYKTLVSSASLGCITSY